MQSYRKNCYLCAMKMPERLSSIGKFRRTHALRGELNAELEVDDTFLEEYPWVIISMEGIPTPFRVEGIRPKGATTSLIKLRGIDSEEQAKELVNRDIEVDADMLEEYSGDDADGMYAADFIGYNVLDEAGHTLGVIAGVNLVSEENPLFQVHDVEGKEVLIPVADELIMAYDPEERTITMTIPEGLLEL